MTYYLGIFPTPGGDKHHLFSLEEQGGTIRNSMGPVTLRELDCSESGFRADMPVGMGKHHFEATYIDDGIHVVGTVIMEGNPVGTYEADMKKVESDALPADPEGPAGPPDGPGPGGTGPMMPPPKHM